MSSNTHPFSLDYIPKFISINSNPQGNSTIEIQTSPTTAPNYLFPTDITVPKQKYEPDAPRPRTTEWFEHSDMWEYPHQTRIMTDPIQPPKSGEDILQWYYDNRIVEFHRKLERLIIFRCIPQYKKQVKISIDHLDNVTWQYWKWQMLKQFPVDKCTKRSIKLPDHGFKRQEYCEGFHWTSTLPYFINRDWQYKKWLDVSTEALFRSKILFLILKRNTWTGEVKAEFNYITEFFNEDNEIWEAI